VESGQDQLHGVSGSWEWDLGSRLSLNTRMELARRQFRDEVREDDLRRFISQLTYQLSPASVLQFALLRDEQGSNVPAQEGYAENQVRIGYTRSF
jgi:hypothetical protein